MAWSTTHADLLMSGGSDWQTIIWNLNLKPHFLLSKIENTASVTGSKHSNKKYSAEHTFFVLKIQVAFSRQIPFKFFYGTSDGQYTVGNLTKPLLDPLVISRFTKEEVLEQEIERAVYYRNFSVAFQSAYEIADKNKKQNP